MVIPRSKQANGNGSAVNLRSDRMREVAQTLATLGLIKVESGGPLNVRHREEVRRSLAEAGETLGWSAIAAVSDDPVETVAKDVKKIVRGGVRSLRRQLDNEIADKKTESRRLEKLVAQVHDIAEDPDVEYPVEIVFLRTAKSSTNGLVTKTETLTLGDRKEAAKAAESVERSLPRWGDLRQQMLEDLKDKRDQLGLLSRNCSTLVESWRGLLREVLVTMP